MTGLLAGLGLLVEAYVEHSDDGIPIAQGVVLLHRGEARSLLLRVAHELRTLTCVIVDPSESPIAADCWIILDGKEEHLSAVKNGRFRLEDLPSDRGDLIIRAEGYIPVVVKDWGLPPERAEARFVLYAGRTIRVRVVDSHGSAYRPL
jgi:hypothetical protein